MTRTVLLPAKAPLFFRGESSNELFIVVEGVIRIGSLQADGREVTLNLIKPGQIFGEIAAFDGSERTADATAVDNVVLLSLSRNNFHAFIARTPESSMRLLAALCDRLRWVSGRFEDMNFLDARGRLAKRLMILAEMFGQTDKDGTIRLGLRLSQQDLASHIGTSREHVNKLLRQWEDEGVLSYKRGKIVLTNPQHLAREF